MHLARRFILGPSERISAIIRRLLARLSPDPAERLSKELLLRLQISQITSWVKISLVTVPVGIVVASALYGTVWAAREDLWLAIGFAGIITCYGLLFWFCLTWLRRKDIDLSVPTYTKVLLVIRLALGCSWAMTLGAMARVGEDPAERSVLFGITIGLMSSAVFGGPVIYALAFWLPVTAGAFNVLFASGFHVGTAPSICLLGYALLTFFAMLAVDRQIAERRLNSVRLERHAETISILLRDFEENASDWLWETDHRLVLHNVSSRFAEVVQAQPRDMQVNLFRILTGEAAVGSVVPRPIAELQGRIEARTPFSQLLVPVRVCSEERWWALSGKPLFDSLGSFAGYRGVGSDVTDEYRSRLRIAHMARHDPLTGLINRSAFNESLLAAMANTSRQRVVLLYLDVDGLKSINDSYGHRIGDSALRAVADRVYAVLRESDIAARIGGDEFAVVVPIEEIDDAIALSERLIETIRTPMQCHGLKINVTISIGIAIAPDHAIDREDLCRNADSALYRAKAAGRCTWRLFDENLDGRLLDRRLLERDIGEALSNRELFVVYQPIVDLHTCEMIGLEALLRWRHPTRGAIASEELVTLAEQSGAIHDIGAFVLSEAGKLIAQLPPPLFVAVNLSPVQVRDEQLLTRISKVLNDAAVSPRRVEFEITESVMLEKSGCSFDILHALRSRGHRIGIDDFGTGYSSLAVLRQFPFDYLKIDRSFTEGLCEHKGAMVHAIVNLAHDLGISVTAEGIELKDQVSILRGYNCPYGQGYYFSKPLSATWVRALIAALPIDRVALPMRSYVTDANGCQPGEPMLDGTVGDLLGPAYSR